ncbi:MAG TPA: hypothetical protein VNF07_04585 [Acidimicrobiales bacterium]|nr:hypothetical protein [Acidimicrobiales bacterium]
MLALNPRHGRPTRDGYLTVAVGRGYADVAPTSGHFSGGAPAISPRGSV